MTPCDECRSAPATVSVRMTVNGARLDVSLCDECARRRAADGGLGLGVLLSEALPPLPPEGLPEDDHTPLFDLEDYATVCSACGLTVREFATEELLGCPQCYIDHAEMMAHVLATIQGIEFQGGESAPGAQQRVEEAGLVRRLTAELDDAVRDEQYMKAARIRDRLRSLRGEVVE